MMCTHCGDEFVAHSCSVRRCGQKVLQHHVMLARGKVIESHVCTNTNTRLRVQREHDESAASRLVSRRISAGLGLTYVVEMTDELFVWHRKWASLLGQGVPAHGTAHERPRPKPFTHNARVEQVVRKGLDSSNASHFAVQQRHFHNVEILPSTTV